jgi:hypothetical protein
VASTPQESQTNIDSDRFQALCAELEEYDHLPELIPGDRTTRLITDQSHEDTIDESILAGLTQP